MNHAVELLAAPCGQQKAVVRYPMLWQVDGTEVSTPVWCEKPIHEQARPSVLEVISLVPQIGNTSIGRAHPIDLIAYVLGIAPRKDRPCTLGVKLAGNKDRDFPFIFRLGRPRPRDFRAEDDTSFRTR